MIMSTPAIPRPDDPKLLETFCDFLKHQTTLATGSILILTGLFEKVFIQPRWRAFIVISLACFVLAVVFGVRAYILVITHQFRTNQHGDNWAWQENWNHILSFGQFAWRNFLLGILSLVVFAIRNLF
jgi:hypothetical protein